MAFERAICTEALFTELGLPENLRGPYGHALGNEIIFDRAGRAVLIPDPYCHGDYPERIYRFYVHGEYFAANQSIGRSRSIDQIMLCFEAKTDDEKCKAIYALFESAMRLVEGDSNLPLPITWRKSWPNPLPTNRVIEKLNQLCNDQPEIDSSGAAPSALADMDELKMLSVISVALIPEEILALREYIRKRGWRGTHLQAKKS